MQHEPELSKPRGATSYEWEYRDGDVLATISSDLKSFCEIQEVSSSNPGKGNAREAIEWMKRQYVSVHVNDPGNEIDAPDAFAFWKGLVDKGLIAGMIDGNSNPIYADGTWIIDNLDPEDYPTLHEELAAASPIPA